MTRAAALKIKVCGITRATNSAGLASLQADFLGMIFAPRSSRRCSLDDARFIRSSVRHRYVGVFADQSISLVLEVCSKLNLDAVQLHGEEDLEYCRELRSGLAGAKLIKAVPIGDLHVLPDMSEFSSTIDLFLLDSTSSGQGGSGRKFNWQLFDGCIFPHPFFLAGGIGPDDSAAIRGIKERQPNLLGVDVNSRFEVAPGAKNISKLAEFIEELAK